MSLAFSIYANMGFWGVHFSTLLTHCHFKKTWEVKNKNWWRARLPTKQQYKAYIHISILSICIFIDIFYYIIFDIHIFILYFILYYILIIFFILFYNPLTYLFILSNMEKELKQLYFNIWETLIIANMPDIQYVDNLVRFLKVGVISFF